MHHFARAIASAARTVSVGMLALACVLVFAAPGEAQQRTGFRRLAPGVMTTIAPDRQEIETYSTHDLVEIRSRTDLRWDPPPHYLSTSRTLYEMASATDFRHRVWGLEFSFKPLRMIHVDIPQPSGKMQRKLVWYMVYRVKNTHTHLEPVQKEDGTYTTRKVEEQVRFIPLLVLESHEFKKAYLDRLLPSAIGPIQEREDPNRRLLSSVEMAEAPIPLSTDQIDRSVWGVATWVDVDPRIDFLSIYVQGLTNAHRWIDPPGVYQVGDPPGKGRQFTRKTLQLNFWRPGDTLMEHEEEIRFGTPKDKAAVYGVDEGVDYTWVYR